MDQEALLELRINIKPQAFSNDFFLWHHLHYYILQSYGIMVLGGRGWGGRGEGGGGEKGMGESQNTITKKG